MELYDIEILSGEGEPIVIGKDSGQKDYITDIDIKLDTVDENVSLKSASMLAKIVIRGTIENEITKELINLFNWAREETESKCYRKLIIRIKNDDSTIRRTFEYEKVFVVDYYEEYHADGEKQDAKGRSKFVLSLTQKKNMLSSIKNF